jgi:beta-xylosidase
VLYYSANSAAEPARHCVGAAVGSDILGPFTPLPDPIACPLSAGGAIDPSGFTDTDGTHYVVYKVDGSSIGLGGPCGHGVDGPIFPTPLMLQQLAADGFTPVGAPIQLIDRGDADGPLIEAPNIILHNGVYIIFFSSNCFNTPLYDISYATATAIKGPWTKATTGALVLTNNPFAITAPGGATATVDGQSLVFHANCGTARCMFEQPITITGHLVTIQ